MKRIAIIGGGISGLAALHFLRQRFPDSKAAEVILYEQQPFLGGTIQTEGELHSLFENGPNGFLSNRPRTLKFIQDVGCSSQVLEASPAAKDRFISLKGELHPFPAGPIQFLGSQLLTLRDKFFILGEQFRKHSALNEFESLYDFAKRHFGETAAKYFLDAMVIGIYGGDSRKLLVKTTFPKLSEWERDHESIIKGFLRSRRQAKKTGRQHKPKLLSMQRGMGQLIKMIGLKYSEDIKLKKELVSVERGISGYRLNFVDEVTEVDDVIVSVPAFVASRVLQKLSPEFTGLSKIFYAPIAVVGLMYKGEALKKRAEGFGYLIPGVESSPILGVLIESNIFPYRAPEGSYMFRVMIGGARNPYIFEKRNEELIQLAVSEIQRHYKDSTGPEKVFVRRWEQAIPQYDADHLAAITKMEAALAQTPGIRVLANYYRGVSLNDCIENAYQLAESIRLA